MVASLTIRYLGNMRRVRLIHLRGYIMKVLDESGQGVEPGTKINLADYGLPVNGTNGLLIVFWKSL